MKQRILLLGLFFIMVPAAQSERTNPGWDDPVKIHTVKIDPSFPPSGVHMMQILLENQSLPLKGTMGCDDDKYTLQHLLALTLGGLIGHDTNKRHQTIISGGCQDAQFKLRSGSTINAWGCRITLVEKTIKKGEFIANADINFGVRKDTWALIPEALTCT